MNTKNIPISATYQQFVVAVKEAAWDLYNRHLEVENKINLSMEENEDIIQASYKLVQEYQKSFASGELREEIAEAWVNNEVGACGWNIMMLA